jgi:hypothetical protein
MEGEKGGCAIGKTRIVEPKGHDSRKIHDKDGTLKTEKDHFRIKTNCHSVTPHKVARPCLYRAISGGAMLSH